MRTALLIVSHSARLAEGVAELAAQMAPDVTVRPVGGTEDGGLGTSVPMISHALVELAGREVVVLTDIGSATLAAATALELLDSDGQVFLADAPLVEGAVAAAAVAQGGGSVAAVAAAAESAWALAPAVPAEFEPVPAILPEAPELPSLTVPGAGEPGVGGGSVPAPAAAVARRTTHLVNELGLHARPAAQLASLAVAEDAHLTLNGVNAASVIALVTLGLPPGAEVVLEASGPRAEHAVAAAIGLIDSGFDPNWRP